MSHCLVFDIGKTHIKWHVLDSKFNTLAVSEITNGVEDKPPYPHFDIDNIWEKFVEVVSALPMVADISRISITTHGAAAALINRDSASGNGLVLPLMDYEFAGVESINSDYNTFRPNFKETGSPQLPAGLNLGRQLFWLQSQFPSEFKSATDILCYPQYWVWRLTGERTNEVTSLGCHTDLWSPWNEDYSSMVKALSWENKFPKIKSAWDCAGTIKSDIAELTGLPDSCEVYVGLHDSNASFLRYKQARKGKPFSIISTGTWSIAMNSDGEQVNLKPSCDMLANVDVWKQPVICSRFMGGREYAEICAELGSDLDEKFTQKDIQNIIDNGILCLPSWQKNTGPFGACSPEILNSNSSEFCGTALASLYCALVLDYQLDLIGSKDDVIISGAFLKNTHLCAVLAQLRATKSADAQPVYASSDNTGTVMGAANLSCWNAPIQDVPTVKVEASNIDTLNKYRELWRERVMPK